MAITDEQLKNAICNNDVEFFEENKNNYKIDKRFKDEDNDTILLYSISDPSTEIYDFFLDNGANVFLNNDMGENIIHAIIYSGSIERLKKITCNYSVDINHRAKDGSTPLLLAISLEKNYLAQYLIELGADINISDNEGITPLHLASQNKDESFLKFLLEKGADPFFKTSRGNLPLALAVNKGHVEIVKLLYEVMYT